MIPPAKRGLFRAWFLRHSRGRLRSTFGAVRIAGLDAAREAVARGPVLVVSNHSSWWDPLVALVVEEALGADGYALMDARNLRRLPFFRMVGALGVDLDRPEDGAAALRACVRLLDRPGRLVWVFPQGRERAEDPRPLGFRPGAAAMARLARDAVTLPVGIRYVFGPRERPELLVSFGGALPRPDRAEARAFRRTQEAAVEAELDRIDGWLADESTAELPALLSRPESGVGRWAEAVLAWISARILPRVDPPPAGPPARSAGPSPASGSDG